MHTLIRTVRLALAASAVAAGSIAVAGPGSLVTAGPAAASPDSAAMSPESVCGGGYKKIDSHDLPGLATIHLLFNGSTNCVVTMKTAHVGTPSFVSAGIGAHPVTWEVGKNVDQGHFKYYAGPMYVHGPGKCIRWIGSAAAPGQSVDPKNIWFSPRCD